MKKLALIISFFIGLASITNAAADSSGVYKLNKATQQFEQIGQGLPDGSNIGDIKFDPNHPADLYAVNCGNAVAANGVWKLTTTDNNPTWTLLPQSGFCPVSLAFDQNGLLYVGGHELNRYDPSGGRFPWVLIGGAAFSVDAIVFDKNNELYAMGIFEGVYKYVAASDSWLLAGANYPTRVTTGLTLDSVGNLYTVGSSQIAWLPAGSSTWQLANQGLPTTTTMDVARIYYDTKSGLVFAGVTGNVYYNTQGALSKPVWSSLANGGFPRNGSAYGMFFDNQSRILYAGVGNGSGPNFGVWKVKLGSTDNWQPMSGFPSKYYASAIIEDASGNIFAATNSDVPVQRK